MFWRRIGTPQALLVLAVLCVVGAALFAVPFAMNEWQARKEIAAACAPDPVSGVKRPLCWETALKHTMEVKGFDATFDQLNDFYTNDEGFRQNCHDVMHFVGKNGYLYFKGSRTLTARSETAYCGYGFYHGFIEAMQVENGWGNYDVVRTYCEDVAKKNPSGAGACFHGIGHALFDSLTASAWGDPVSMTSTAIGECDKALTNEFARVQCSSGVYNALANAARANDYELSFNLIRFPALCNDQRTEYVEKCYAEVGVAYMRNRGMDREQSVTFIRTLRADMSLHELYVYFADEAKSRIASFDATQFAEDCEALRENERQSCIAGVIEGIRAVSPAETAHTKQFPFCQALTRPDTTPYCLQEIVRITQSFVRTNALFKKACLDSGLPNTLTECTKQ
jgi:hypothetical protein